MISWVVLQRGGLEESRHRVHLAVTDAAGTLVASAGDPDRITYIRSAAKPFQLLPLLKRGFARRFGFTPEELALCCGSHNAEPRHLKGVRRILSRCQGREEELECGPHFPMGEEAARELERSGEEPRPIHNNCSGKHAGMIALARGEGWDPAGYRLPDHPVQRCIREELGHWVDGERAEIPLGVDGCGVPTFGLPIRRMAMAFARLAQAEARGEEAPAAVLEAMTSHPFMVAGTGRLCTELMEAAEGRVMVKLGAEGVYGAALRGRGMGLALKVEDGGRRACEVAVVAALDSLGALSPPARGRLDGWLRRAIPNTLGEEVAWLEAREEDGTTGLSPGDGR